MEKGEIACCEQFLLFPQCFQKACFPEASKGVIVWEWVKLSGPPKDWIFNRVNSDNSVVLREITLTFRFY